MASFFGQIKIICELLKHDDVDANPRDNDGHTSLIVASMNEHWDVVGELLKHDNFDLNLQWHLGYMVLMWASLKGRLDMAFVLLKHDNVDANLKNIASSTALDVTHNFEWLDIAHLLEQHHANLFLQHCDVKSGYI